MASPKSTTDQPIRVDLLALPETTGSILYSLNDVLASVGGVWSRLTGEPATHPGFEVRIVALSEELFRCAGGVPVIPQASLAGARRADLVMITDLDIDIDQDPRGRWPQAAEWVAAQHARGAMICSVCSGSILLAEAGLLDGEQATTHWAVAPLFAACYPAVDLRPEKVLLPAGLGHRIVTSGGSAAWEDLALYLVHRFCGGVEALRIAKIFLLGDRSEGQLPFAAMARPRRHEDAVIADSQLWIADHYAVANPVSRLVDRSGLPERTFKRRFRAATGYSPVAYVQTLRVEEAKQQLERSAMPTDEVAFAVGYEDPAFFRRLFKRHTGVTPARYRQRVRAVGRLGEHLTEAGQKRPRPEEAPQRSG